MGDGNSTLPIFVPNRLSFLCKTFSTYIPSKHEICIPRRRSATPLTLSKLIYNNMNHVVFYVLFTQAYLARSTWPLPRPSLCPSQALPLRPTLLFHHLQRLPASNRKIMRWCSFRKGFIISSHQQC